MQSTVQGVVPETLLVDLPHVPEWFREELSQVAARNGKPMFRLVDGQRELKWRCGKMDVKHLVYHDELPCYVPTVRQVFRRKNRVTGDYVVYPTYAVAAADENPDLWKPIDYANFVSTRAIGKACWVVEVYIDPEEFGGEAGWEQQRWKDMEIHGVYRKVDVLGPFPREGTYMYCFSVVDEEGRAISPNRRTIEECQMRWRQILGDTKSLEQELKDVADREAEFDRKQLARISDSFYQFHGISAKRLTGGAIGKPITKIYE